MTQAPSPLQTALARHPGLDPKAVMAVAAQEGLGGGIGDQGTSFGPFQLHYGGAYPSFAPHGAQASQAWAWSPAGLDYALSGIDSVADGLRGGPAVRNIVSRFERPANIPREIAGALAAYGGQVGADRGPAAYGGSSVGGGATAGPVLPVVAAAPVDNRAAFARALTGAISPTGQLNNPLALISALQTLRG